MAFTMACPNFKKGLKMVYGPLGVKLPSTSLASHLEFQVGSHNKSGTYTTLLYYNVTLGIN
jgi:hypothetical protein